MTSTARYQESKGSPKKNSKKDKEKKRVVRVIVIMEREYNKQMKKRIKYKQVSKEKKELEMM